MFDFFTDAIQAVVMTLLVLCFAVVCALGITGLFESQKCAELVRISEHQYHWDLFSGCKVQTPSGLWIDVDDVEYLLGEFDVREEGK